MTARELATVLAALRYYQNSPSIGEPSYVNDIATGNGAFEHMTADEIDDLCEKLNLGEAKPEVETEDSPWSIADQHAAMGDGWFLNRDTRQIERDDEGSIFPNDDFADAHVRQMASEGSELHRRAVAIVDRTDAQ